MMPVSEEQIKQFISQLREDLGTAERFFAMWKRRNQEHVGSSRQPEQLPLNGSNQEREKSSADVVRNAIRRCPRVFTLDDLEEALETNDQPMVRLALNRCVNRLLAAKRPILKVAQKGMGRLPAKYEQL